MKSYATGEVRNIVILGHSGCGKTTVTESALYYSGATKRFGKVSDGNTTSDYDPEEIRRGVSIQTTVIPVEWMDTKINFIDTPGYFDFVGEVKSALAAADAALIVVSGKSGPEVGTEKAWDFCESVSMPRMIFVNQMDDENADFNRTLGQMRKKFGKAVAPFQIPLRDDNGKFIGFINCIERYARVIQDSKDGKILVDAEVPEIMTGEVESLRNMLIESAAESDDELLEKYFNEETLTEEEIYKGLHEGILNGSVAPVLCGAVTLGYGIKVLMTSIVKYIPASNACISSVDCEDAKTGDIIELPMDSNGHLAALVFKTISDPYVGRLNYFKVFSGTLKKDMTIYNVQKDTEERIAHVYISRGKDLIEVDSVHAGDIGALSKLSNTSTNDTIAEKSFPVKLETIQFPKPVHAMAITPKGKGDEDKISAALTKLREEDPTILVEVNPETKQTIVTGLGEQHLDILLSELKTKFKIEAELSDPIIPYREMIKSKVEVRGKYKKQSGGHGQYGDVLMTFEPLGDLTKQYEFEEKIFGGSVPKQYFPAVEKGLQECIQSGVLAGYPVVGLKATLIDGSYHPVDSSEMAFKMATSMAFKEGLTRAKPTILEPIAHVEVLAPEKYMGDIMGDINKRRGRILKMNPEGKNMRISAEVPLSEMHKYCTNLRSMTQSRGEYTYSFERYDEAPADVQASVIEKAKNAKGNDA
ncbi:MAG: elongation factor G [Clostridia bacterium]|jgi:elongation factor G|nr:elongation factor G [Clostridia bacterium]